MSDDHRIKDIEEVKDDVLRTMKETFPTYGSMNMHLVDANAPTDNELYVDTALIDIYQYRKANQWKWYCNEFCSLFKSIDIEEDSVRGVTRDQLQSIIEGANKLRLVNSLLILYPDRMPIGIVRSLYAFLYPSDNTVSDIQSTQKFEVFGIFDMFSQMGKVLAQAGAVHPVHALSIMGQLQDQFKSKFGEYNNAIRKDFELSKKRWQPKKVFQHHIKMTFLHLVMDCSYSEIGRRYKRTDTQVREWIRTTKEILLEIPEEQPFPADLLEVLRSSGLSVPIS